MSSIAKLSVTIVALAVVGCGGSKPALNSPPPPVSAIPAGFTEIPMIRSSRSVEPATFNVEIGAAARRSEYWVRDPGLVALHVSKAAEAPLVRLYRQDNRGESPDSSTVTVIMDRLLDDSIAGIWTEYRMVREADGSWQVAGVRQAYKSYRGEDTEYYRAEPAP